LCPREGSEFYAIAKTYLNPGDKIIISPITCKTVIYALLSAGIIPIFVDIDSNSGNIDVEGIPEKHLREARAIITTNLYGNPDNALEIRAIADSYKINND